MELSFNGRIVCSQVTTASAAAAAANKKNVFVMHH